MNASLKAAWLLIALVGFALWCATPATAENEQVQFYNSPAAVAAKLPFSQAVREVPSASCQAKGNWFRTELNLRRSR